MPPLIAKSEVSSIHLSWINPARSNGLPILGFVLEYLVIEDKQAHERSSFEVQDIWKGCVRIEVLESEHYLYHLRPDTTVWARVAVNAKGHSVFSASAIFSTSQDEPTERMHMCVPDDHAQEATMQNWDMLIEMVPESSLPDNQMLTPVAAPRVQVLNIPMQTPRDPSLRPTCLVPLYQQTKRRKHSYQQGIVHQWPTIQIRLGKHTCQAYVIPDLNYGLVWQDICKEEPPEDADEEFTRLAVVCATEREYLTASDLWDRSVREGEQLVIQTMEQASVELMTGFTRTSHFFRFDPIEVMLIDICAATEAGRGSLADFCTALFQTVEILHDDKVRACGFYDFYVENKILQDLEISCHEIRAPNKERVHFVLKDLVAFSSTTEPKTVSPTTTIHNGLSIEEGVEFTTTTAAMVNPNVGAQLVAEGLTPVGAQTAACKSQCDVVTSSVHPKVLLGRTGGAPLPHNPSPTSPPGVSSQIQTSNDGCWSSSNSALCTILR